MRAFSGKNFVIFAVILFSVLGCNFCYETKTIETRRGRLNYVQVLRYGTGGTHGSKGWYGVSKQFYINDRAWLLPESFDGCDASPNESVEVFNCFKVENLREMAFLARIKDEKFEWIKINDEDSTKSSGKNLGEWVNEEDGRWLIFKDFFYQVETDEKREIKGLPDYPERYFRAASPDLETVVYEGSCYYGYWDAPAELKEKREKLCHESEKLEKMKLVRFWLTDVKTGEARFIQLSREKYDWLFWDQEKFPARRDWLKFVQKEFIWEKDRTGKYQLVAPKSDEVSKKK